MSSEVTIQIDDQGHAVCPDCNKSINCGPGGLKFLETRHRGKKRCLADAAKRAPNGAPRLKNSSILSFLQPAVPLSRVPSQTQEPAQISGMYMSLEPPPLCEPGSPESSPATAAVITYQTRLANEFHIAVDNLPQNETDGETDLLAIFAKGPAYYDNPSIEADNLWEEILNLLLKEALGWGTVLDVGAVVRGKREGLAGIAPFIEYFVQRRQVSEGLLEGKLGHLLSGLKALGIKKSVAPYPPAFFLDSISLEFRISDIIIIEKENEHTDVSLAGVPIEAPIDVDAFQEAAPISKAVVVFAKPAPKKVSAVNICGGIRLAFPSGSSPHTTYPFALHDTRNVPWNYKVVDGVMVLHSIGCSSTVSRPESGVCAPCRDLKESNGMLKGIIKRIGEGRIQDSLPYAYRSVGQLLSTLHQKDNIIDFLRLRGLNQAKALLVRSQALSEHKRFMVAIASGKYGNVERIIRIGLRQNRSIASIVSSYHAAATGMYKPKSYTEEEDMKGLLLFKLGGSRVAGIAHRALGLPAVSTLRTRAIMPPLIPSHTTPSVAEVMANMEACFESITDVLDGNLVVHQVAMWDEIATEKRLRWDQATNFFLGICREHGMRTSLEFNNVDDMEELFAGLEKKEIHHAAEATVCALGLLSEDTRIYAGRPVLISGDCKRETGDEHANILQVVIDAANNMRPKTRLRVVSLASDGETRRGTALALLTFKQKLSPASPIYPLLSPLQFMDLHVGDDDLTADKDWKHVIKRFRNLLLRARGVLVLGIRITPAIIESHLKMCGATAVHVHTLFAPDDEQDVKLAFDLLKAIWSLPALAEHRNPSVVETRGALLVLGKLLYHIVFPYLCVDLTLSEQLEHFSAAAHLALILYHSAGKLFIPTLLYVDLMIMIKNVYFCVAKAKIDNPNGKFFVLLLGTDRLEELFGILRTMIGNDANLDIWQLASRLTATTQISNILAKYPQWDRAPRRLKLPAISRDSTELPDTSDHIKPGSWRGNVYVKQVTLQTSWNRGRRLVEDECIFTKSIFLSLEGPPVTILSPATKLLVGASVYEEADESQELILPSVQSSQNIAVPSTPVTAAPLASFHVSAPHSPATVSSDQAEIEDEMIASSLPSADAEDLDNTSLSSKPTSSTKVERFIIYNGKKMIKSRALSLRSRLTGKVAPSSTDRLKRVQELERYGKGSSFQPTEDTDSLSTLIVIQDPVATLVKCDGNIFLCLGEVNNIKIDSQSVASVSLEDILVADAGKILISLSLLGLRRSTDKDDPSMVSDWRSYRMSSERTLHVPAKYVQPVNPSISARGLGQLFYLLEGRFLVALATSLFGSLVKVDIKKLCSIAISNEFPYYEETGKACFAISSPQLDNITGTMNACPRCDPEYELTGKGGPRILGHMASHILHDPKVELNDLPCGLCLRPAPLCHFVVRKGPGGKVRIDLKSSSGCPNMVNFKYSIAEVSTATSPCSNVPMICDSCPEKSPAQWRYNLEKHYLTTHTKEAYLKYQHKWALTQQELDSMESLWKARYSQTIKRSTESSKRKLVVSDAHTSRATLRDAPEMITDDSADETDDETEKSVPNVPLHVEEEEVLEPHVKHTDDMSITDEMNSEIAPDNRPSGVIESSSDTHSDSELPEYIVSTRADVISSTASLSPQAAPDSTAHHVDSIGGDAAAENASGGSGEHPTQPADAQRPQRKRGRINLLELSKCICGESAYPTAGQADSVPPSALICKQKTCETTWYHLACVNLEYIPKNWKCEACIGDRSVKRTRGM